MILLDLKEKVKKKIDLIDDIDQLEDYFNFLSTNSIWSSLSQNDKNDLIDMSINSNKYTWISHENALNKLSKWRKK